MTSPEKPEPTEPGEKQGPPWDHDKLPPGVKLQDCISTFPDTFDNPERDEEMGPGEGARDRAIAQLRRAIGNETHLREAAEKHIEHLTQRVHEFQAQRETAWRERDAALTEMIETRKLLQMAITLLAHFAGRDMTIEIVDRIGMWGLGWMIAATLIVLGFLAMRDG